MNDHQRATTADHKRRNPDQHGAVRTESMEHPVDVRGVAALTGISVPAVWKAVSDGRLPRPVYPAPRAPRWYPSEVRAALDKTRAMPADAMAERRRTKLAAAASA